MMSVTKRGAVYLLVLVASTLWWGTVFAEPFQDHQDSAILLNLGSLWVNEPRLVLSIPTRPGYRQEVHQVQQLQDEMVAVGVQEQPEAPDGIAEGRVFIFWRAASQIEFLGAVTVGEYFERFEELPVHSPTTPWRSTLAIYGLSGNDYHNLKLVELAKDHHLQELFVDGSAVGVSAWYDDDRDQTMVKLGVERDEPGWNYATGRRLWKVYAWDGTAFAYRSSLSSAEGKPSR